MESEDIGTLGLGEDRPSDQSLQAFRLPSPDIVSGSKHPGHSIHESEHGGLDDDCAQEEESLWVDQPHGNMDGDLDGTEAATAVAEENIPSGDQESKMEDPLPSSEPNGATLPVSEILTNSLGQGGIIPTGSPSENLTDKIDQGPAETRKLPLLKQNFTPRGFWNRHQRRKEKRREKNDEKQARKRKSGQEPSFPAKRVKSKGTEAQHKALEATKNLHRIKEAMPADYDIRRTNTQAADLRMSADSFGYKTFNDSDNTFYAPKMKTLLLGHQMTLAAWMVQRECMNSEPFGGVVADEMGMGKTIVSISCARANPLHRDERGKYAPTTLVILPNVTIALQWREEIRRHCGEDNLSVIYSLGKGQSLRDEVKRPFVLITYKELVNQFPSKAKIQELKGETAGDEDLFDKQLQAGSGDLFKVDWYRVILDEAHAIKNESSITSMACCRLSAKYRWCLSGTPLANSPDEYFPYVRFIGCSFAQKRSHFHNIYVKSASAAKNFDALVALTMYRRTHKDTFLGQKILDLEGSVTQNIIVPLSVEENIIYDAVAQHYNRILEKLRYKRHRSHSTEDDHDAKKNIKNAMMSTLRQAVSHPFTLENLMRTAMSGNSLRILRENLASANGKRALVDHVGQALDVSHQKSFREGLKRVADMKGSPFGGHLDIDRILTMSENETRLRGKSCDYCEKRFGEEPMFSVNIGCKHKFCLLCTKAKQICSGDKAADSGAPKSQCPTPECTMALNPRAMTTLHDVSDQVNKKPDYQEPGIDRVKNRIRQHPTEAAFFAASCLEKNASMPPSSKLTVAMAVIFQWQIQFPQDKIIVFTQWVVTGKILGYMLEKARIGFVYLYGPLSEMQRKVALEAFQTEPDIKILVAGLKCGGQALNLTVANRVILIDPWWNTTAESQAFGRVNRIGQKKTTHLVRIFSDANVEKRLRDLQRKKKGVISRSLQDDGHKPSKLDDGDLTSLFIPGSPEALEQRNPRREYRRIPSTRNGNTLGVKRRTAPSTTASATRLGAKKKESKH